ncbi:MAG: hypothetical protein M1830_001310, partial [Pleopsidium flavum]
MWILECDGDILQNKRVWLRPGKKYLFGRTRPQRASGGVFIDDKSISRQHLTISLAAVQLGDGSKVHPRSELSVKDENSKLGTQLDGEQIRGQSKILTKDEHVFKLGNFEQLFRIKWHPVVLSFSFSSKEQKSKDPLIPVRARLEDLDIKAIIPYVIDKTTHVVANKRNTAKGLQALINAKYIVTDSFVDALVYAATPTDLDEPESLSPLEEDFDANWPDATQHLPAPGKEPRPRAAAFFAPDPKRSNVFEGYTFVFADLTQFETLQAAIANGGGKALYYELEMGKTSVEDLVRYVKNVAGEKGLGEFEDGSEGKGVVVVRFRGKKEYENWAVELGNEVAIRLDQRLIEQSEFLDAILTNDASILRKPLPEEEDDGTGAPPPTAPLVQLRVADPPQATQAADTPPSAQPEASQPSAKRSRPRRAITSRFKGFDDGFDPDLLPPSSRKMEDVTQLNDIAEDNVSQRDSQIGSPAESAMDVDPQVPSVTGTQAKSSRKRPSPLSDGENEDAMVESLLPAAAAMKRRRIEVEKENERQGISNEPWFGKLQEKAGTEKKRKPKKEVNIQEVVRERREAEEEAARRDEESLRETLDGMDVDQMKNLALIEEMEVQKCVDRPARSEAHHGHDSRWDERWNGRKNFKKFRRRGDPNQPRRGQSVIVPLEEVKKKDFGIGDEYWLESDKHKKKRKEKEKQRNSQGVTQDQSQPYLTARSQAGGVDEDDADMLQVIDAPR